VEDANLRCGGQVLPSDALLDLQLLDFEAPEALVYLTQIIVYPISPFTSLIQFTLEYGTTTRTITVNENAATHIPINYGTAEPYRITATYGPGIGTIGDWGNGTYVFDEPPQIEPALLNFENKHRIDSVQALDPVDQQVLTGVVHVREGYNCRVSIIDADNLVIVSAQRGAGRGIPCDSQEDDIVLCNEVLLRINGLVADSEGNFQFFAGAGVSIEADPGNHTVIFRSGLNDSDRTRCG